MSIVLKVKPQELMSKANSIMTSINFIGKDLEAIGDVIIGTKKYWEGDAATAHQKYYSAFKNDIPTLIKRLKEHPKDLLQMADLYDEAERLNQQQATKLPKNVIV